MEKDWLLTGSTDKTTLCREYVSIVNLLVNIGDKTSIWLDQNGFSFLDPFLITQLIGTTIKAFELKHKKSPIKNNKLLLAYKKREHVGF
jgi:hypothetical protein